MLQPSRGNVLIGDYDIVSQTARARKELGICPQFNTLFDKYA